VLGRYRLRRRLGTGAFATVWLAHDERLGREVAVKILARERVVGGRFEREARAAARLAHPGIVTLYEAAVDDEGAYLVSEFVRGTTLEKLFSAGRLSDRDVLLIGIALCDALDHAHAHGVIHRDVKPSNVLVPERPSMPAQIARLTDFGVAHVVGGNSLTHTGDVIGTAAYMAPEQAQGLPAGAAADLFAFALVLYEALSGVNPLRSTVAAQTARRSAAHLPPLRRRRRELPRELGRTIDLALRPRPGERGSLEELRAALVASADRVADEAGVVAAPGPGHARRDPGTAGHELADEQEQEQEQEREQDQEPTRGRSRHPPARGARRHPRAREREDGDRAAALSWPRRALAGAATAAVIAWLARHVPGASPIPAAGLIACVAGVIVAAMPRGGWLAVIVTTSGSLIVHSHPGEALVLLVAGLVPVALSPRDGPVWPLAAAAPALAGLGLATAWPALAGLTGRAHRRAALATTGWLWAALWAQGIPASSTLHEAVHHVLGPLVAAGTLISCGVWALAALTLPWTTSRRWPALECVRLSLWAIGLGLGTIAAQRLGGSTVAAGAGTALLGAFAGALVALVTRRLAARVQGPQSANESPPTS
jgi:hypothetical protein